jgi:hypothetical protein
VFDTIGKRAMSTQTIVRAVKPSGAQNAMIGVIARIGIYWRMTAYG